MKRKIEITFITVLLIAMIIGGQLTSAKMSRESEKTLVTYTIGYLPITHALPLFEEKELLEQENSEIRIELQKFNSWPDLTDALHAGKIDGASELIELAMSAKTKGVDLKAVALGHRDGNVIVVSSQMDNVEDLKGKNFAIPSTQSSHYILLQEELENVGLNLNDIQITQLAPSEMPSSLASGAIDGYCVAEPFGAQAVTQGYGKILTQSENLWSDSICCGLIFREDVIEKNPEAFEKLLDGYMRSGENLDQKEALKIAEQYLGQDKETLETSLEWIKYDDLEITEEAYSELYTKVIEDGIMENPPTYEEFVYQRK